MILKNLSLQVLVEVNMKANVLRIILDCKEEAVLPFENQNLPEPPLEEKTDGGRFISPPPPPSSPLGNNLDESNKKAAEILVTKEVMKQQNIC